MVITMLNGSPKIKESNSENYLDRLAEHLKDVAITKKYSIQKHALTEEEMSSFLESDVWVIAFPLYVDGMPSHLLEQLIALEQACKTRPHKKAKVYVVANNGFYEGDQNEYALAMIKNFCKRAGLEWGQGIGIGTGEMIGVLIKQKVPLGKGPLTSCGKVWDEFVSHIKAQTSGEDLYTQSNFPSFAFRYMAKWSFWDANAKKNGISKKALSKRWVYNKDEK